MPTESAVIELVRRFEEGFNTGDVDALMADMTDDAVFEHVAPEGVSVGRHEGASAVRAVWESMPEHFPGCRFVIEDIFASGDRCLCRFSMTFRAGDGSAVTRRGADVFTVRDGKIAAKLTYLTL